MELSIVLVILGLLTGGILAGQSLIHAAELRSVIGDYQRFSAARQTFRDKYMALPGDMPNATRFWLRSSTDVNCITNSAAAVGSPGTCDGNGDSILWDAAVTPAAGASAEAFQFWRQLALAGLIEGSYTGMVGSASTTDHDAGINCPAGRVANTIWGSTYFSNLSGANSSRFAYDFRNALVFGADDDNNRADGPALMIEDIWNIDSKLDDGKPGAGFVICGHLGCSTATGPFDFAAEYKVDSASKSWVHFLR